jgi:uncharacterized protein (DUF58 family)
VSLLSKEAKGLLTLFAMLFVLGLLLANPPMLLMSLIPIFAYLVGLSIPVPLVEAKRTGTKNSVFVGDRLRVQIKGTIRRGVGGVTIWDELPESFQLISGSNYRVFWKGVKDREFSCEYEIRCQKRGKFHFEKAQWESRHFLSLREPSYGSFDERKELIVRSRILFLRRVRTPPNVASTLYPKESISKLGAVSTNFQSIREYTRGDPFKFINWKATARFMAKGRDGLLVNEYEREGKRAVWIFLDAHPSLQVGTSIENCFDYCVEAADSIAYYFLNQGFLLGMCIYNAGTSFYPDTGMKQYLKIARALINLGPRFHYKEESIAKTVEKIRIHLANLSPLVIIITHLTPERIDALMDGVTNILIHYRTVGRKVNVMVINILPYDLIPQSHDLAATVREMLEIENRVLCHRLQKAGIYVVNWNPQREDFGSKLMKYIRFKVIA